LPYPANPTLPAPVTWTTGMGLKATRLRADVSDAVALLTNRPVFIGQNTSGSSWASGSSFNLGMNAEISDTWNGHSTTSSDSSYWCQFAGWYLCRLAVPFNYVTATTNGFAAGLIVTTGGVSAGNVNGSLLLFGNGRQGPAPKTVDLLEMTRTGAIGGSGDSIGFTALQETGSSITLGSSSTLLPYVSIRWVAATAGTTSLPVPVNAAWPVPPSYITSAFMNTNVRDTINFLIYPPICKAYYAPGSLSLPSQAFPAATPLNLNATSVDNYGGYTTGASGGYTAPVAGNYFCYGQFTLINNTSSTGYCCGLRVNSGTVQWGDSIFKGSDTSGGGAQVGKRLRLNAGDFVQVMACQGTGASIPYSTNTSYQTRAIFVWEGA
jgi:hypothetical protein